LGIIADLKATRDKVTSSSFCHETRSTPIAIISCRGSMAQHLIAGANQ
ncbi:11228_t:CDS:1, partial [Racocetra persica]